MTMECSQMFALVFLLFENCHFHSSEFRYHICDTAALSSMAALFKCRFLIPRTFPTRHKHVLLGTLSTGIRDPGCVLHFNTMQMKQADPRIVEPVKELIQGPVELLPQRPISGVGLPARSCTVKHHAGERSARAASGQSGTSQVQIESRGTTCNISKRCHCLAQAGLWFVAVFQAFSNPPPFS